MKPLTAREFWSLDRDERERRIDYAFEHDVCSACGKPILDGEARNGLHASHYDCTDLGPPPTDTEFGKLVEKIDNTILQLKKSNRR